MFNLYPLIFKVVPKEMKETNFMQIIKQTDKEKMVMYMRCTKKKLALMLIQANKIVESVKPTLDLNKKISD